MAKVKPQRQCIGCGEKKEKNELIRIVKESEDVFSLDPSGRKNGRGAYICKDPQCLEKAFKKKSIERAFKMPVPAGTYEKLKGEFENLG